jgi:hypothetical protein
MKIKIERLWHGFASVRDYKVMKARQLHEGIDLYCENEHAFIPYDRLDEGFKNKVMFHSKHQKGQNYSLIDYDWCTFRAKEQQFQLFT